MKKMQRTAALLLALLLVTPFMTSCGESKENTDQPAGTTTTVTPAASVGEEETDAVEEDPNAALFADLPTGNYNGQNFSILTPIHSEYDFIGEIDGDIISEAVYKRNLAVEEDLGVTINPISEAGLWNDRDGFLNSIKNSVMAMDDEYQLVSGYGAYITSTASDGVVANWNEVPSVNFEKPWWNHDIVNEMNVADHLFFVTGDLSMTSVEYLMCLFANKAMMADYDLTMPYDTVKEGAWTFDAMTAYANMVHEDLDGNGKMTIDDKYGYSTDNTNFVSCYIAAFDADVTVKGDDGLPVLAIQDESFTDKYLKLYNFLCKSESVFLSSVEGSYTDDLNRQATKVFSEGRALFEAQIVGNAAALRAVEFDFGILPLPKYDESQQAYYTTAWDAYNMFCVPRTADLSYVGIVTENLAARSFETVLPAFYDKALTSKYVRDEQSAEMIELIRSSAVYNFGVVNSKNVGSPGHLWRDLLGAGDENLASKIAGTIRAMNKALERFVNDNYVNAE